MRCNGCNTKKSVAAVLYFVHYADVANHRFFYRSRSPQVTLTHICYFAAHTLSYACFARGASRLLRPGAGAQYRCKTRRYTDATGAEARRYTHLLCMLLLFEQCGTP